MRPSGGYAKSSNGKGQAKSKWNGPIYRRLRTWVTITCLQCHRQVRKGIFLEQRERLVCSACGSKYSRIEGREPMQDWARARLGR